MFSKEKSSLAEQGFEDAGRPLAREPIAIIGIGCRYAGIANSREFWQMLIDGREAVGPYPGGRFAELDRMFVEAGRPPARVRTDRGGFLQDVAGFDAQFFEISPREAVYFDPQHRLLLEVAWEALEDAGQVRGNYAGSATGVYTGLWTSEYESRLYESRTANDFYSLTGCGRASASGRVSFALGLQGPSLTVDTACSSSLVAVHLACRDLWADDIEMALAGGANLTLGPEIFELFTRAKMLSPDGRCKFGDASADGFVRSEGAGMVVLKRLSRAIADRDPIHAVIRGTAVNNDGHSSGFLTPSRAGQQEMLRAAWKSAGVEARDIRYIEMHGTGTNVGDPIEIGSVGAALEENGVSQPCWLGSVKTNIGHTESASGVAGLIKAALALQHRTIPPSLNYAVPNPRVAWDSMPVRIASAAVDLSSQPGPLLAGVNSFGLSGTNAHVVLEEAILVPANSSTESGAYLLTVSARTPEALQTLLRAHLEALRRGGASYPLRDVCYTASVRRTHHEHRAAIAGEDRAALEDNLAAAAAGEELDGVTFGRVGSGGHRFVFVAPGQGSQWPGMARELIHSNPIFRRAFEECEAAIAGETGWRLSDRLLGVDAERHLSHIDFIQPALFTMSVALSAVWRGWGVEPEAVVGHSMGEVAAAHLAGILSLEDAAAVICRRSRLMKTLSSAGGMASIELPLKAVEALLAGREGISVGASNGPHSTVVSGDSGAVEALLGELEAQEVYCRRIKVDVASHSAQVDPILDQLFVELAAIRPQPAKIPMLSTVTGRFAANGDNDGVVMDAHYWVENLRRAVLFAPAIGALAASGHDTFVELSPHPILLPSTEASARASNPGAIAVASLRREKQERATLLTGVAQLYVAGRSIPWATFYPEDARCVALPQYPFQRERYWPEPADPARGLSARQSGEAGPLLGRRFTSSLQPDALLWESRLDIAALPYLNDHRVLRSAVFPASGHVAMALAAARAVRPGKTFELRNVAFLSAVYLPDEGAKPFQLALKPAGTDAFRFELRGADRTENQEEKTGEAAWTLYSSGVMAAMDTDAAMPAPMPIEDLKQRCPLRRTADEHYAIATEMGLNYGPAFQLVQEVWLGEGEALCQVSCAIDDGGQYAIHPALLDACFQATGHLCLRQDGFTDEDTYLPVMIKNIRILQALPDVGELYTHAELAGTNVEKGTLRADLHILDAVGNVLAQVVGLELMRVTRESLEGAVEPLWTVEWIEEKLHRNAQEKAEAAVVLSPRAAAQDWIVFADRTGIAEAMERMLVSAGGRCTRVRPGAGFRKTGKAEFEIDPRERKDLDRLIEAVAIDGAAPTAIVYLWALDQTSTDGYDAETLMRAQALGSKYIPGLVQAISQANWPNPPRLWLGTAGAMTVTASDGPPRIEDAPLWGMARSVAREHAELRATSVDLSAIADPAEARGLVLEICADGREDRIALRGGAKYVARLAQLSHAPPEAATHLLGEGEDYRLEISSTGILDDIELRARTRCLPKAGEIAVEISVAGLNFSDITKVMGLYPGLVPGQPIPLGNEAVGRVIAVGEGVTEFRLGDDVIALTPNMRTDGMMASHAIVPVELAVHKPACLSDEQAATVAVVYLTAYWALIDQARLRRGEWVLIHAGAGGVGLAAIAIAKWVGANIIATVGSREKEDTLHSLGIEHVLSSRSLSFAPGVMEITAGRGVDVVLNSLSGEFLLKSAEVLAPYGRFVELGKRDVYGDSPLGLKVLRNNNSFHVVDVAAGVEDRRPYIAQVLAEVMRHIESGEWPPLPVVSFSSAEPAEPFRYMAQARQIGKICIRMDRNVQVLPATDGKLFSSSAAYLITGGLGGVALTVAEWMARNGAGHLVLLSRRARTPEADESIARIEAAGATVVHFRTDVTRADDIGHVIKTLHERGVPLKGILHAAALVDDVLIRDSEPDRFVPVMAPKIVGAWNLHEATKGEGLDFFILFSSIAALSPQPGMGSYAAANAFLDAFAWYLRSEGTTAISVNWGGWKQIGLARATGTGRSIEGYSSEGMRTFSGEEALEALRRILESRPVQVLAQPIDARQMVEFHGPSGVPPLYADVVARAHASQAVQSERSEILDRLQAAEAAGREDILEAYLEETLSRVLKLAAHRMDRQRPLGSMGLDSLMGLEFVRRLSSALEIAVPATAIFNYPTIRLLAANLLRRMHLDPAEDPGGAASVPSVAPALHERGAAVGDLSGNISEEEALHALIGERRHS